MSGNDIITIIQRCHKGCGHDHSGHALRGDGDCLAMGCDCKGCECPTCEGKHGRSTKRVLAEKRALEAKDAEYERKKRERSMSWMYP